MREAKKTGLLHKRSDARHRSTMLLFGHMSQKKKQRSEMQRRKVAVYYDPECNICNYPASPKE